MSFRDNKELLIRQFFIKKISDIGDIVLGIHSLHLSCIFARYVLQELLIL